MSQSGEAVRLLVAGHLGEDQNNGGEAVEHQRPVDEFDRRATAEGLSEALTERRQEIEITKGAQA